MKIYTCHLCNKSVPAKAFINHLKHYHLGVSKMDYYEKYLRQSPDEGKCLTCGKPTRMKGFKYRRFCSQIGCNLKCITTQALRKQKSLERYGVDSPNKAGVVKQHKRKSLLQIHGVDNVRKIPEVKRIIAEKRKIACLKEYGVEQYASTAVVKERIKQTKLLHYGIGDYNGNDKRQRTCMKKYGVDNVRKIPDIIERVRYKSYNKKDYRLPSGKIVQVQGYENRVLDQLFKDGYQESDILTVIADIKSKVGIIYYCDALGVKHRYFPDIYIISENKIIEVKSEYTYKRELEKNLLKQQACLNRGLNFEFRILK